MFVRRTTEAPTGLNSSIDDALRFLSAEPR